MKKRVAPQLHSEADVELADGEGEGTVVDTLDEHDDEETKPRMSPYGAMSEEEYAQLPLELRAIDVIMRAMLVQRRAGEGYASAYAMASICVVTTFAVFVAVALAGCLQGAPSLETMVGTLEAVDYLFYVCVHLYMLSVEPNWLLRIVAKGEKVAPVRNELWWLRVLHVVAVAIIATYCSFIFIGIGAYASNEQVLSPVQALRAQVWIAAGVPWLGAVPEVLHLGMTISAVYGMLVVYLVSVVAKRCVDACMQQIDTWVRLDADDLLVLNGEHVRAMELVEELNRTCGVLTGLPLSIALGFIVVELIAVTQSGPTWQSVLGLLRFAAIIPLLVPLMRLHTANRLLREKMAKWSGIRDGCAQDGAVQAQVVLDGMRGRLQGVRLVGVTVTAKLMVELVSVTATAFLVLSGRRG